MGNKKIKLKEPNYSFLIGFLLKVGMLVSLFGIVCFILGFYLQADGHAFILLSYRFLIAGLISSAASFILKYYPVIKFILKTKIKGEKPPV